MTDKPAKPTGLAHVLAATRYSLYGAQRLWREAAFRHELLAFAILAAVFAVSAAPLWAYLGASVLLLITVAVESLNTAIEEITDHISPGYSEMAKHAKDMGSFAVCCLVLANGLWAAWVLALAWNLVPA